MSLRNSFASDRSPSRSWPIILGAGFHDGLTCLESLTQISMRVTSEQSTTGTRCFAKASARKRSLGAQQQRTGCDPASIRPSASRKLMGATDLKVADDGV